MKEVNQGEESSSLGFATVSLPARDINTWLLDGTVVDLDLPPIRSGL